ncbi:uncharacterized protein LOC114246508 [Bombyx mandarina]|uniref:Uncharacterized protein LOC114246508 n=1 Tax=Bombyx mandarina TaxID=7092 RepID=A0A6J2JY85_BOMMA|nr:uncharacterized protein LOC114246508 [Bombyx mandarina]
MDFTDKVVIVTGASSGIGAATAVLYAKQSAKVVIVGRNETGLNKVAQQCEAAKGLKPLIVKADLTSDEDVKKIATRTIEIFGKIDVLVNNAGVGFRGSVRDGVELFDQAMASNLRPAYLLTGLITQHLMKTKGNIVNVSSVAAFRPIKDLDFTPYCISKAGLDMFTKCVALELARDGIRVNSVNPGGTKTPFVEAAGFTKQQAEEVFENRKTIYPLGKVCQTEEVAELILYLSSEKARSITGGIFVIDNGEILT